MATATFQHKFHIEGRPFHVRHDRIVAVGQSPYYDSDQIDPRTNQPFEGAVPELHSVLFIDGGLGNMVVDEDLDEVLTIWKSTYL